MKKAIALLVAAVLAGCGAAALDVSQGRPTDTPAPATPALDSAPTSAPPTVAAPAAPTATPPAASPAAEPTTAAPTAASPAAEPTTAALTATPPAASPAAKPTTAAPTAQAAAGGTILFLREGNLWAFELASRAERLLADRVSDFAATADGERIALVRRDGEQTDLWSVGRDGGGLARLTNDPAVEASPSWTAAGDALVFAAASRAAPSAPDWQSWAEWCAGSQVRLLEAESGSAQTLADGCDPAISPDGARIAYATAPTARSDSSTSETLLARNSVRLINRRGQNGWNFAKADGGLAAPPNNGELVYAPAWSPDGAQLAHHRFLGYQALVDINISETGPSFGGGSQPLDVGAGWLLPARFAPGGRLVAITEHNYSDARGLSGYALWSVTLIELEGSREIAMPSGPLTAVGQQIDQLQLAQRVAWSPDGAQLAVELPPNWQPAAEPGEDGAQGQPGEVWRWQPGAAPSERLISRVDPASPLAWLP